MRADKDQLFIAIQKNNIAQAIVDYLHSQQAENSEFFNLYLDNKINGRLFYNTCLPNGSKETRYDNHDFLNNEFQQTVDDLLAPFNEITAQQVHAEFMRSTHLSAQMNHIISSLLFHIETSNAWKAFWRNDINLRCSDEQKKQCYRLVVSTAAYKALVATIDHSHYILDPSTRRNVTDLIGICTDKYESAFLQDIVIHSSTPVDNEKIGRFKPFKKQKITDKKVPAHAQSADSKSLKKKKSVATDMVAHK